MCQVFYRHSLIDCASSKLYLSVCLCMCPVFTAFISITMCWILKELGGHVETQNRLIALKFQKNRFSSAYDVIMTLFLILTFYDSEMILRLRETIIMLCSDCDTSAATAILFLHLLKFLNDIIETISNHFFMNRHPQGDASNIIYEIKKTKLISIMNDFIFSCTDHKSDR